MIFVFILILFFIVIFVGHYIMSFNFLLGDFRNLYSDFFQAEIINNRNFDLSDSYQKYYNGDANLSGNNDFVCDNGSDDDCLFRGLYGFAPPKKKIDLGVFSNVEGSGINLTFTGNISSGVEIIIQRVDGYSNFKKVFFSSGYITEELKGGNYSIKLTNLGTGRIQYFFYVNKGEGFKDFTMSGTGFGSVSQKFNHFLKSNSLMPSNINYNIDFLVLVSDFLLSVTGLSDSLANKLSSIHFFAGGSDFDGIFIVSDIISLTTGEIIQITDGTEQKDCDTQLEGYYRNSTKNDTIRPLDADLLAYWQAEDNSYSGISLTGGFYSACESDPNSIYGEIIYSYSGSELFSLQTGREYDFTGNSINVTSTGFKKSFQFYNGIIPFGIIADTDSGIGFVGGKLDAVVTLQKLITELNNGWQMNQVINNITESEIIFTTLIGGKATRMVSE